MKLEGHKIEDSLAITNFSFNDGGTKVQPTRKPGAIVFENDELREQLLILNKDLLKVNKEKKDNINLEIDNESSPSKE